MCTDGVNYNKTECSQMAETRKAMLQAGRKAYTDISYSELQVQKREIFVVLDLLSKKGGRAEGRQKEREREREREREGRESERICVSVINTCYRKIKTDSVCAKSSEYENLCMTLV